jgi:uncharacterized membrane protein YkvA (DUF1232 family)
MSRSSSTRPKIGWVRALLRYYRDPSASVLGKLVIFLALIYVVVPVDLIPDVPIVGWLDDIGVMGLATAWLGRVAARYREAEALPRADDPVERRPFSVSP